MLFRSLDPADMAITVTLAAQSPDAIDREAVARELPYGKVTVETVRGGLDITHPTGARSVIVNAAIEVRHPMIATTAPET